MDNTRGKRAAVDNVRNPPVPHISQEREVLLPAYLAPPGAQQGTAGNSSLEQANATCPGRPSSGRGNDSIHHSDDGSARDLRDEVAAHARPPYAREDGSASTHFIEAAIKAVAYSTGQAVVRPGTTTSSGSPLTKLVEIVSEAAKHVSRTLAPRCGPCCDGPRPHAQPARPPTSTSTSTFTG